MLRKLGLVAALAVVLGGCYSPGYAYRRPYYYGWHHYGWRR
jgi:hypothetical protein